MGMAWSGTSCSGVGKARATDVTVRDRVDGRSR